MNICLWFYCIKYIYNGTWKVIIYDSMQPAFLCILMNSHQKLIFCNLETHRVQEEQLSHYGLFTLPDTGSDSDSDLDSKPDGYIVLCRSFHIGSDPDLDPCTESFPNHYCTHFRNRYLSQGQMSIPIPHISIRGSESGSEPMWNFCIVQESESESESESGNVNKHITLHFTTFWLCTLKEWLGKLCCQSLSRCKIGTIEAKVIDISPTWKYWSHWNFSGVILVGFPSNR